MTIDLPWPPKELFPNAKRKAHWSRYAPKAAAYRRTCWALALEARAAGTLRAITFLPPDRIRRDDDGMIGAFKSGRDGIADALRVDDSTFRPAYHFGEPVEGGLVRVRIEQ